jgi:glycerophosphoryl diester phosphodiesterase
MVDFHHWPYPRYVAHRGAGKLAPENTLAAMRLGAKFGYKMFEFDVKLSADAIPFLLHDATTDRTSNRSADAGALSFGELALLDAGSWHSAAFAGEAMPSLEAIARWTLANELMVNIEIKPVPGAETTTGTAVALAARALWAHAKVPPLLSSFSAEALIAARAAAPELPRAALVERLPDDWVAYCQRLGCVAIDPNWRQLTAPVIAQAHASQLRVLTYTVNDPQKAAELLALGLDCLITDAVDRIVPE